MIGYHGWHHCGYIQHVQYAVPLYPSFTLACMLLKLLSNSCEIWIPNAKQTIVRNIFKNIPAPICHVSIFGVVSKIGTIGLKGEEPHHDCRKNREGTVQAPIGPYWKCYTNDAAKIKVKVKFHLSEKHWCAHKNNTEDLVHKGWTLIYW